MVFGTNLAALRSALKLSQDDVAGALNMTRPAYKQLETGGREPSMVELQAISELFGVRIDSLDEDLEHQVSTGTTVAADGLHKLKYKNLILYLAQEVGARPNVGETVFYKLIYFIETLARAKFGTGIANENFCKMQYGPVPTSFRAITDDMINSNELDKMTGRYFTYRQTKYLPRIKPSGFTDAEQGVIDHIIDVLGDKSATELSDLSHRDAPWIKAANGEIVNLSLTTETDVDWREKMGRPLTSGVL